MKRVALSAWIALTIALVLVQRADAGLAWCARDPVVSLNGKPVQIIVAIPEDYLPMVTGPIYVDVALPDGVTGELLSTDEGFLGYGEVVTFSQMQETVNANGLTVAKFSISVPIGDLTDVPMLVTIIPEGQPAMYSRGVNGGRSTVVAIS